MKTFKKWRSLVRDRGVTFAKSTQPAERELWRYLILPPFGAMKVISFSIFGQSHSRPFFAGAVANLCEARAYYPGWKCRFYIGPYVTTAQEKLLVEEGGEIRRVAHDEGWEGLFWRFLVASDLTVDTFLVRDTDSCFTWREVEAVNEWLRSDKQFHVMRDHPHHDIPILGGMWGARGNILRDMDKLVAAWPTKSFKGSDQRFLESIVHPRVKHTTLAHDDGYYCFELDTRPFPRANSSVVEFAGGYMFLRDMTPDITEPMRLCVSVDAAERARMLDELARECQNAQSQRTQVQALMGELDAIRASTSWRVTRPLRGLGRGLRMLTNQIRRPIGLPQLPDYIKAVFWHLTGSRF
jgi:hypothetical protein